MKKFIALFVAIASAIAFSANAENYSTEATLTSNTARNTFQVVVRVSQLLEQGGKTVEKLISQPRINTSPGVPASLYSGRSPKDADYQTSDNVSVDVSWPKAGERGMAFCTVVVKRGDKLVSKSKFQLQVEGK